ncbi:Rv0361 family membrane protein [Nocardia heshunensis]
MSDQKDDQQPQGAADKAARPAAESQDTAPRKTPADQSAPDATPADAAPPTAATEVIPSPNTRTEEITTGAAKPGFATIHYDAPAPSGAGRVQPPAGAGRVQPPAAPQSAPGNQPPAARQGSGAFAPQNQPSSQPANPGQPSGQPSSAGQSGSGGQPSAPAAPGGQSRPANGGPAAGAQKAGGEAGGGSQSGQPSAAGGGRGPGASSPADDAPTQYIPIQRPSGDKKAPDAEVSADATTQLIKIQRPGQGASGSGAGKPDSAMQSGSAAGAVAGGAAAAGALAGKPDAQGGSGPADASEAQGKPAPQDVPTQGMAEVPGADAEASDGPTTAKKGDAQQDSTKPDAGSTEDEKSGGAADSGAAPAGDAETVVIKKVPVPVDDATMALPIVTGEAGTEKIRVSGPQGRAVSKPPQSPRGNAGPRNVGPRGSAPAQDAPVEETRPAPPRPPMGPRRPGGAPSPADMQPTTPGQPIGGPRIAPPQRVGAGAPQGPQGPRGPQAPNAPQGPSGPTAPQGPGGPNAPQASQPSQAPLAQPQRVPAADAVDGEKKAGAGSKKKVLIIAAAVVVVAAVVGVVTGLVMKNKSDNSPEALVQKTITSYTDALNNGNLDTLRAVTCGAPHDFYQKISADQFTGVYRTSKEQKSIPLVKSLDAIKVTGDTAIAQATVYTAADPTKTTARTFDLKNEGGSWKVCDPQSGN